MIINLPEIFANPCCHTVVIVHSSDYHVKVSCFILIALGVPNSFSEFRFDLFL